MKLIGEFLRYQNKQADAEIGLKIKNQRKNLRVTQKELADAIGVTFQQVQKYESGHSRISMSTFMNICHELKVEPGSFFGGFSLCEGKPEKVVVNGDVEKKILRLLRSIKNIKIQSRVLNLLEVLVADLNDEESE